LEPHGIKDILTRPTYRFAHSNYVQSNSLLCIEALEVEKTLLRNLTCLTSYFLPLTSYFLPLTSYLLPLTSYLLPLTSYLLPLTSYLLLLTSYLLLLTSYLTIPISYFLHPTSGITAPSHFPEHSIHPTTSQTPHYSNAPCGSQEKTSRTTISLNDKP
jgi:hypothetical protein